MEEFWNNHLAPVRIEVTKDTYTRLQQISQLDTMQQHMLDELLNGLVNNDIPKIRKAVLSLTRGAVLIDDATLRAWHEKYGHDFWQDVLGAKLE